MQCSSEINNLLLSCTATRTRYYRRRRRHGCRRPACSFDGEHPGCATLLRVPTAADAQRAVVAASVQVVRRGHELPPP